MSVYNSCKNYFHAFNTLSHPKDHSTKEKVIAGLSLASYITVVVPAAALVTMGLAKLFGKVSNKNSSSKSHLDKRVTQSAAGVKPFAPKPSSAGLSEPSPKGTALTFLPKGQSEPEVPLPSPFEQPNPSIHSVSEPQHIFNQPKEVEISSQPNEDPFALVDYGQSDNDKSDYSIYHSNPQSLLSTPVVSMAQRYQYVNEIDGYAPAALNGDVKAQCEIAIRFFKLNNPNEAYQWLHMPPNNAGVTAAYEYSQRCDDPAAKLYWASEAMNLGDRVALAELTKPEARNEGKQAAGAYLRSISQGYFEVSDPNFARTAFPAVSAFFDRLTGSFNESFYKKVSEKANQGDPDALFSLAEHSLRVLANTNEERVGLDSMAFNTYQALAQKNYPGAAHKMAMCLQHGIGIQKNEDAALLALRSAADAGEFFAQFDLATVLEHKGEYTNAAKIYYELIQQSRDLKTRASDRISALYLEGKLGEYDAVTAQEYLREAGRI